MSKFATPSQWCKTLFHRKPAPRRRVEKAVGRGAGKGDDQGLPGHVAIDPQPIDRRLSGLRPIGNFCVVGDAISKRQQRAEESGFVEVEQAGTLDQRPHLDEAAGSLLALVGPIFASCSASLALCCSRRLMRSASEVRAIPYNLR